MARRLHPSPYEIMFFLIMRDGPTYGYELADRFRKMTRGHIDVSYGTIYPFLRRMKQRGFVGSRRDKKTGRVYYEPTKRGKEVLARLSKEIMESKEEAEEHILGVMSIHARLFGRKAHNSLLKRIR